MLEIEGRIIVHHHHKIYLEVTASHLLQVLFQRAMLQLHSQTVSGV